MKEQVSEAKNQLQTLQKADRAILPLAFTSGCSMSNVFLAFEDMRNHAGDATWLYVVAAGVMGLLSIRYGIIYSKNYNSVKTHLENTSFRATSMNKHEQ